MLFGSFLLSIHLHTARGEKKPFWKKFLVPPIKKVVEMNTFKIAPGFQPIINNNSNDLITHIEETFQQHPDKAIPLHVSPETLNQLHLTDDVHYKGELHRGGVITFNTEVGDTEYEYKCTCPKPQQALVTFGMQTKQGYQTLEATAISASTLGVKKFQVIFPEETKDQKKKTTSTKPQAAYLVPFDHLGEFEYYFKDYGFQQIATDEAYPMDYLCVDYREARTDIMGAVAASTFLNDPVFFSKLLYEGLKAMKTKKP